MKATMQTENGTGQNTSFGNIRRIETVVIKWVSFFFSQNSKFMRGLNVENFQIDISYVFRFEGQRVPT